MGVIGVLVSRPAADLPADAELEALRSTLDETGVHFLGVDDGHVSFTLHGDAHPPASAKQVAEMLGEIRPVWRS
jgi:hypothetical protein